MAVATEGYEIKVVGDRIAVISPYDIGVISSVKEIEGRRWDGDNRRWTVPISQYEEVIKRFDYFEYPANWEELTAAWASQPEPEPEPDGYISSADERILVAWQPSHPRFDEFKAIAKAAKGYWDSGLKKWLFALEQGELVKAAFPSFVVDASVNEEIARHEQEKKDLIERKAHELKGLLLSAGLDEPFIKGENTFYLREHQKVGVAEMIHRVESSSLRGVILADDMGLGKTAEALVFARAYQRQLGLMVLIVCPAALKDNWKREASMFGVKVEVYSWAKQPEIPSSPYVIIFDEAHYAQSGKKSARGKQFLALSSHVNCRAAIPATGTPMKNGRPINIEPLLMAIAHPIVKDKTAFEIRYCKAGPTQYSRWDTSGAAHLDEMALKIADGMIRRTKKECLDLPPKERIFRPVQPEGDRLKQYRSEVARIMEEYESAKENLEPAAALNMLTDLITASSMAKIDDAVEWAEEVLEQGNPVVIYSIRKEPLEEIGKALSGWGVEFLHGGADDRQSMVDRFQSGESKVFLYTMAGGQGITLTAAQYGYMLNRPWTPGDAEQAEDRLHRIGQTGNVAWFWAQLGQIDQKIDAVLAQKQERIEKVMEGQRKTMRGMKSVGDMAKDLVSEFMKSEGKKLAKEAAK